MRLLQGDEKAPFTNHVNLGFIVQSSDALYVIVARQAESMDERTFVQELGDLQRAAMRNKLKPENTWGATIGFSRHGAMAGYQPTCQFCCRKPPL